MLRLPVIIVMFLFVFMKMDAQENDTKIVRVMNFDQLQPYLQMDNDTVYLVNFWATWCMPCRKEMPAIQAVEEKYGGEKFKVLLVSLDFPGQVESALVPYIMKNNIRSEVILLDDPDQNRWINLVDPDWSGDIPFTIIYGKNFRESHSGALTFEKLDSIINTKINSQ